ncbi:permease-like cell division protein FtsX [Anaerosoma tenue]|uniref:permease-like cell division protein FtsX n=1 Tax=Anaerosoma tenue TaxID=2933588 RepID=UPI002260C3AD|nr:permease-like cell division protein FtsX [Anaerosoma tenue]MCK8114552.1 permease-like cell division protein FtsX [Anaerosoma tenue]
MAINVGYFVKESFVSFKRNWVMSLGAIITIYLSLLLVGVSLGSGMLLDQVVQSVEDKVSIRIFLKDGAPAEEVDALQQQLLTNDMVDTVVYTSKEQALEDFKESMVQDSPEIIDQLEGNPLPASLDVELKDPRNVQAVVDSIKASETFTTVADRPDDPEKSLKYGQQIVNQLFTVTRIIRTLSIVFVVMLAVISLIFINNAIRLAIYARRKEIAIMRLVGASNWFIRTPFLMEGVIQSLIGALLAIGTLSLVYFYVLPSLSEMLAFLPISLSTADALQVSLALVAAGIVMGLVGAMLALRRYLKV